MGAPFTNRIPKKFENIVTFSNVAGKGAIGVVLVATITGAVNLVTLSARCITALAGANATISLGLVGNTDSILKSGSPRSR